MAHTRDMVKLLPEPPLDPSPLVFDLAFIDVETSHLDERVGEILDLCIVRVDSRTMQEKARFQRFFLPTKPVDPGAAAVNGYTEGLWRARGAGVMTAGDLYEILAILDGAAITGWNVKFDRGFLWEAYRQLHVRLPAVDYHMIDVAGYAWPLVVAGRVRGLSLKYSRKFFGLEGEQKHSAEADVDDEIAVFKGYMSMYVGIPRCEAWWPVAADANNAHKEKTPTVR